MKQITELVKKLEHMGYPVIAGWDVSEVKTLAEEGKQDWLDLVFQPFHPKNDTAAAIADEIRLLLCPAVV